jgi:aspartyl aminopeptidase
LQTKGQSWADGQSTELLQLLSQSLNCQPEDILDFDLSIYDTQKASTSGMFDEFIVSSRIDNLASCFVALEALQNSAEFNDENEGINMIALFDHEEVGSESQIGAGSTLMKDAVDRISYSFHDGPEDIEMFKVAISK